MKKIIITVFVLSFIALTTRAQILTPVRWSFGAKKLNNNEAVVFMKATIDDGWHLYSQYVKEGGPIKTTFTFPASSAYSLE
jgi:hypothetical protein